MTKPAQKAPSVADAEVRHKIGNLISRVSETAYCAGWMMHAEYSVFHLMTVGGRWGVTDAAEVCEELGVLRSLSEGHQIWVTWCDIHEDCGTPLARWRDLYAQWVEEGCPEQHQYDDGPAARPGDLCMWCLAEKRDPTRYAALTAPIDEETTDA